MGKRSRFVGCTIKEVIGYERQPRRSDVTPREHMNMKLIQDDIGASLSAGTDPEQERDPPPPATPVTFPDYSGCESIPRDGSLPTPDFRSLFAKIAKPTDISKSHGDALNIDICPAQGIEDLLPLDSGGKSYCPQVILTPDQAMAPEAYSEAPFADPTASQQRKEFHNRLAELQVDNDTAFRSLTRTMKNGAKPHRLAYMRKFWEGLENMSQYWDTSLDQYYEVSSYSQSSEQSAKRQRLDVDQGKSGQSDRSISDQKQSDANSKAPADPSQPQPRKQEEERETPQNEVNDETTPSNQEIPLGGATHDPQPRLKYKGRRTHTGREVPDQFRAETVRAFVEGVAWPFQFSIAAPRLMPIVQFGKLNLPVRQSAAVYRMPKDRMRARSGRLEGPVAAIQVRVDTEFVDENGNHLAEKARLDLMRELGGLIQLAQERRREGKIEHKPGEGKWWTTKPRWGGGTGGEAQNEAGISDAMQVANDILGEVKGAPKTEPTVRREKDGSKVRRKKTNAELWKELKCGNSHWDPKTDYAAIGKDPSSPYDEIFMISSLNHHICVVKLTVHEAYIDSLTTGMAPDPLPEDRSWCRPKLQRSQWFDLFDMEQRVNAFRGLWGVMAYLNRDVGQMAAASGAFSEVGKGSQDAPMGGTE